MISGPALRLFPSAAGINVSPNFEWQIARDYNQLTGVVETHHTLDPRQLRLTWFLSSKNKLHGLIERFAVKQVRGVSNVSPEQMKLRTLT